MKCEDLLTMLNEYVDGTVDPAICAEFEKHMAGCNPCQVVVDNIRKTITLYKAGQPYDAPGFRQRLTRRSGNWRENAAHPAERERTVQAAVAAGAGAGTTRGYGPFTAAIAFADA